MVGFRKRVKSFLKDPLQYRAEPGECPVCGYQGHFLTYSTPPQRRTLCPNCKSGPRHRLLQICFDEMDLWTLGDVLHFAPEKCLKEKIRDRAARYLSADVREGRADVVENVEALTQADASFDTVIANHIFEHIDNDRAGFAEIHRVLRPGGRAVLSVPLIYSWPVTYEDDAITAANDRDRHFGQNDHVRFYGRDFADRFAEPGFHVTVFPAPADKVHAHALNRHEVVFVGTKL